MISNRCRRRPIRLLIGFIFFAPGVFCLGAQPHSRAHAHNDYEHERPLLDALDQRFCSVEADIHLVDGQLLVGHDRNQVRPDRTLEKLYLDPLRERARRNGGRIYRDGPDFYLLIDFKSGAEETYRILRDVLLRYTSILTRFGYDSTERGAVTIVISGHRPRETMAAEAVRYAAVDGRINDLDSGSSTHLVPWISDNWTANFKWRGIGLMPEEDRIKARTIIEKAHAQGRRVRFWATADSPEVWGELLDLGVDFINSDHLSGLAAFLAERESQAEDKLQGVYNKCNSMWHGLPAHEVFPVFLMAKMAISGSR